MTSAEEYTKLSGQKCEAVINWLATCNAYPSLLTDGPRSPSPCQTKCRTTPYRRTSQRLGYSSVTTGDPTKSAGRRRGTSRRGISVSRGRSDKLEASPRGPGIEDDEKGSLRSPNPNESTSVVSTGPDFDPTTLSQTTFTATSISRETRSSRSQSPTKKISDLMCAKPPIKVGMVTKAPDTVRPLLNKFRSICDGIGVLPLGVKAQIYETDSYEYPNIFFGDSAPGTQDDLEVFENLMALKEAAEICHNLRKPEPSWGEEVFRPLLDFAIGLANKDSNKKAQVENVTTSPIFPPSLVPTGLHNLPFMSKRVDYCIYLSQTEAQEKFSREILVDRGLDVFEDGINQAGSSSYIRLLPQLVAVECKASQPGTDGMVQLAVWMAALRKRLERLGRQHEMQSEGQEAYLKPMPCLKIEGLNWQIYWCCVGNNGETMLYGPQNLGSTTDMKGMYQILEGLREIIRYGRDEYWPWFSETMLWKKSE